LQTNQIIDPETDGVSSSGRKRNWNQGRNESFCQM